MSGSRSWTGTGSSIASKTRSMRMEINRNRDIGLYLPAETCTPEEVECDLSTQAPGKKYMSVQTVRSSFPQAFGGNPGMIAGLDSRQKPAGMTEWCYTKNPESLFMPGASHRNFQLMAPPTHNGEPSGARSANARAPCWALVELWNLSHGCRDLDLRDARQ
jgi:hypothetical protein